MNSTTWQYPCTNAFVYRTVHRFLRCTVVAILTTLAGCALHYYDTDTGTEHIWGVGHMAMKVGSTAVELGSVARRTDVLGVSVGRRQDEGAHLEIGWAATQRVDILQNDTKLCLAWRDSSFYQVRVGDVFPLAMDDCTKSTEDHTQ